MPITNTSVVVGETTYSITTLPGDKGLELIVLLPKFAGGALGALFAMDEDAPMDPLLVMRALGELGAQMASPDFLRFVYGLLDGVSIQGGPGIGSQTLSTRAVFATHFAGNYGALLRVLVATGRHNFGGFFDAFPEFGALLQRAAAKAAPTPRTASPGKSPSS